MVEKLVFKQNLPQIPMCRVFGSLVKWNDVMDLADAKDAC